MKNGRINWGIIGCGDVTEVKSGPAFNKVPHSGLVAVMRRDAAKAKDYAKRHGIAKWYPNADDLINDPEVNAIYIATPPLYHEEYTIEALRAGKAVYVEKPMSTNAEGARRMADVSSTTGIKLTVAHYRREQPLFLKIKSLLDEKRIGDVRLVNMEFLQPHYSKMIAQTEVPWRLDPAVSGGGLFHDLAPHGLDLMLYFFGKPIEAKGNSFNAAGLYDADDTTIGHLIFENKILFTARWCFTVPEKRDRCEIIGTKGTIRFSVFNHQPLVCIRDGKEMLFEFDKLQHVQQPMIQEVVNYFLGLRDNPCSGEDGLEVMQMIDVFTNK